MSASTKHHAKTVGEIQSVGSAEEKGTAKVQSFLTLACQPIPVPEYGVLPGHGLL